jgi:homoserine acetyltransferase
MRSLDHQFTWSERMGEVAVPLLVMVGAADLQRPPESVRAAVEMLGSEHVLYRELGVHLGLAADHGHDDVLAARSSPFEIYPIITDWLELQRTERGGVVSGSGGVGGAGFGEAE